MTALRDYTSALARSSAGGGVSRYDEVVAPGGGLRPAWRGLAEVALELSADRLRRVHDDIERSLADDGVTYAQPGAGPGEGPGEGRGEGPGPWRLDPVPLVLAADEWGPLEVGLTQRTELLNAILVDLYGPRRLLADGVLPPAVVFGHPGYLRTLARASTQEPWPLLLAAADLGRDGAGRWVATGDRAQAPSGIGYAMQNRRVISRTMPDLYRSASLHRMAPFLSALRAALTQAAPGDAADPRVVVLSPGTGSETRFDQAFVASALGLPLVQGGDLVVRDGRVHLRVTGDLQQVDVILRRVDAAWSDPLELRGDSRLGVPGLTECVRRGTVRVVNGLGAGVLESPALLPYLPAACERLLGEELRLGSVPTHWGGDPAGRAALVSGLDGLAVRAVDGRAERLRTGADRDRVAAAIEAEPHRWVGQERLPLSQAPVLGAEGIAPRPVTLRTFTLRYGSAYRPMVGGLASAPVRPGEPAAIVSKDVWVLKASPDDADQGLADALPVGSLRAMPALVPRVLEDLWWFGRYAERTEDLVRLVLVTHALAEDFGLRPASTGGQALAVLRATVARVAGQGDDLRAVLLEADRPGTVAHGVAALRETAQSVRDQLSGDTWRAFGVVDRARELLASSASEQRTGESAGRMLTGLLALHGMTTGMVRDPGWHLLAAGRHLERALQLCHLLRPTLTERRGLDVDRRVQEAVLTAAESAVTHRRRFRGNVRTPGVLDLLLRDPDNPRSLASALTEVRDHLAALPDSTGATRPERLLDELLRQVEATTVSELVAIGGVNRPLLERFLDGVADQASAIGEAVAALHFPAPRPRAFGLSAVGG